MLTEEGLEAARAAPRSSCSVAASSHLTYSASPWSPHTARLFSRRPQRLCQLIPGEVQAVGWETDSAGTSSPGLMSLSTPLCILCLHLPSCKVGMIESPVTNKAEGLAPSRVTVTVLCL